MQTERRTADEQYRLIIECRSSELSDFQWCNERKRSIMSTLTNARPLTWPAVLVSLVYEFCLAASVTMEADLPEMTGLFDPDIWEAQ